MPYNAVFAHLRLSSMSENKDIWHEISQYIHLCGTSHPYLTSKHEHRVCWYPTQVSLTIRQISSNLLIEYFPLAIHRRPTYYLSTFRESDVPQRTTETQPLSCLGRRALPNACQVTSNGLRVELEHPPVREQNLRPIGSCDNCTVIDETPTLLRSPFAPWYSSMSSGISGGRDQGLND